jgi:type I restriction enzyme M protein
VEYPPTSEIIAEIEKLNQEVEKETAEFKKLLGL